MEIERFAIIPADVETGRQVGVPFLRVAGLCPCGCSPHPYLTLSDGQVGLTLRFKDDAEVRMFKRAVRDFPKRGVTLTLDVLREGERVERG